MKFTIVSHAGLLVEDAGKSVLFDPWIVGSCYWRRWWNLPAPGPALGAFLLLVDLYEHELVPLTRNLSGRSIATRARRWREAVQAGALLWSRAAKGRSPTPMELYSRL